MAAIAIRLIRGETQPEEQAQIDERIQTYQARFDAEQRQRRRSPQIRRRR